MNQNPEKILIRKASGETEPFDVNKLKHSLKRSTADSQLIEEIADTIQN
jgi:transcriptional regulator NrdR family protein